MGAALVLALEVWRACRAPDLATAIESLGRLQIDTCPGLPRLQRIVIARPGWIGGVADVVELLQTPVARRLHAITVVTGDTTFELYRDEAGALCRLRIELADYEPFTLRPHHADLLTLAGAVAISSIEIVARAPAPPHLNTLVATELLGRLAALPRRITIAPRSRAVNGTSASTVS